MDDYINREDARALINKSVSCLAPKVEVMGYKHGVITGLNMACDIVEALSSADVAPVRHGRWEKNDDYTCSLCGYRMVIGDGAYNYCPKCGARMDAKE